jgi:phage terminase small subunit
VTPKQEAFVAAYMETGSASEAYRSAYRAARMSAESVHVAASRLLADAKVTLRLNELRAAAAKRNALTIDNLAAEYEEARKVALKNDDPKAMVAATDGKARLAEQQQLQELSAKLDKLESAASRGWTH